MCRDERERWCWWYSNSYSSMCTVEKKKERTRLTNKHEREEEKLIWPLSLSLSPCLKGYIKMSKIMIKNKKRTVHFLVLLT